MHPNLLFTPQLFLTQETWHVLSVWDSEEPVYLTLKLSSALRAPLIVTTVTLNSMDVSTEGQVPNMKELEASFTP